MKADVTKEVKGRWLNILIELGIPENFLNGKNGPCPLCGGKDRFRFTDFHNEGRYICNQCGNGDGWNLVQKYFDINFASAAKQIKGILGITGGIPVDNPKFDPVPALRKVAEEARPLMGYTSVTKYLDSRGFTSYPEGLQQATLKFYKDMKSQGEYEVLVALIKDWEGNAVSYHLTYTKDGKKADIDPARKVMTPKGTISGAAIRLHIDFEDKICIAEGIESAYAAHIDSGLPAFAAMNSNCLENFIPPKGIEQVWIYADNDRNYTGQASAYKLGKRLMAKGIEAWVFIPDKIGQDQNDVLMSTMEEQNNKSFVTMQIKN
jgi:putative DNA primase/helicase